MILGIGTDIVETQRISAVLSKYSERFLQRILTPREREYCERLKNPVGSIAARWAAKEAVSKAIGTGIGEIGWLDIEIRNHPSGKPEVVFSPRTKRIMGKTMVLISLSHCEAYATATAIWIEMKE